MDLTLIEHDLEMVRQMLIEIDTLQVTLDSQRQSEQTALHCQLIHERSFVARSVIDKILGELGLSDGSMRLSDYDRARAGRAAND
jgi:hypothetical protein